MPDWANGQRKVIPGKKVYLFTGPAGNAIDQLIAQAVEGVDYVRSVYPPLSSDLLNSVIGTMDDTQALVVRNIEDMPNESWHLVDRYLHRTKIKGTSLVLAGEKFPDTYDAKEVKPVIIRQGTFVDTSTPGGESGMSSLVQWVGEEWQITKAHAEEACKRTGYSVERLVWATRIYKTLSGGKVLIGHTAQKYVRASTPVTVAESAYKLILAKKQPEALAVVAELKTEQFLGFFRLLEAALTDLEAIYKVISVNTKVSPKMISDKSGVHIVRVLDLTGVAPRYNATTVAQCRQALQLGLANHSQPEAAATVVSMWG